ncbi:hypothetical protein JOC95_002036 [Bacillus tianshenii]|uniref:Swt1-like HEPN domain-containing protein n=1 Tax=Sutcliffiella tianshenii TaxID=1463404 RepID=A0ABS2P0C0_9BACI|nr:Swt1 family HEPN domain-containing protein [Bacillus tianshenii]MBM7620183.1 hypothetical protein [Bacillus tianshenii]
MISTKDLAVMKTAYEKIYIIENLLRMYISKRMKAKYGEHWFYIAPNKTLKRMPKGSFDSKNFHDLESYLHIYSALFKEVSPNFTFYLRPLYPIRNKIAHNQMLTGEELSQLTESFQYITNIFEFNGEGVLN